MRRRAFTLVETLVVLGMIAVLMAMIFPAIQLMRASADKAACASNLRQLGLALTQFHGDHGRLPPAIDHVPPSWDRNRPELYFTFLVAILPYIEQQALYDAALAAYAVNSNPLINPPHTGYAKVVRLYVCPTDRRLYSAVPDLLGVPTGLTSYVGNMATGGDTGVLPRIPGTQFNEITDGLSNTLMMGERPPPDTLQSGRWYTALSDPTITYQRDFDVGVFTSFRVIPDDPCSAFPESFQFGPGQTDNPCDRWHFWSLHPAGANFLFCDGSVRYLSYRMKDLILPLSTRNGGEVVEMPD